jgi:hypothetical protein
MKWRPVWLEAYWEVLWLRLEELRRTSWNVDSGSLQSYLLHTVGGDHSEAFFGSHRLLARLDVVVPHTQDDVFLRSLLQHPFIVVKLELDVEGTRTLDLVLALVAFAINVRTSILEGIRETWLRRRAGSWVDWYLVDSGDSVEVLFLRARERRSPGQGVIVDIDARHFGDGDVREGEVCK